MQFQTLTRKVEDLCELSLRPEDCGHVTRGVILRGAMAEINAPCFPRCSSPISLSCVCPWCVGGYAPPAQEPSGGKRPATSAKDPAFRARLAALPRQQTREARRAMTHDRRAGWRERGSSPTMHSSSSTSERRKQLLYKFARELSPRDSQRLKRSSRHWGESGAARHRASVCRYRRGQTFAQSICWIMAARKTVGDPSCTLTRLAEPKMHVSRVPEEAR